MILKKLSNIPLQKKLAFVVLTLGLVLTVFALGQLEKKETTKAATKTDYIQEIASCKEADNITICWDDLIKSELDNNGLDGAFVLFGELFANEPGFAVSCHDFAHELGVFAYEKYSKGEDFDLTPKTSYCGYGFYHGFMENLLIDTGEPTKAVEFCEFVGEKLSSQSSDANGACYHGIGHGSVDGSDPRAWGNPQAMVDVGLDLCEKATVNEQQLYRCITGAYNSLEILSQTPKYRLADFRDNTFAFCAKQKTSYQEGCYTNMLPALLSIYEADFEKIARLIEDISEVNDSYDIRYMVLSGLFHEYYRVNLGREDFAQTGTSICRKLNERSHQPCIEGLSGGMMKYGEPTKEYVKTLEFCANSILGEEEAKTCYQRTLSTLTIWYPVDKVRTICLSAPKEYQGFCSVKL